MSKVGKLYKVEFWCGLWSEIFVRFLSIWLQKFNYLLQKWCPKLVLQLWKFECLLIRNLATFLSYDCLDSILRVTGSRLLDGGSVISFGIFMKPLGSLSRFILWEWCWKKLGQKTRQWTLPSLEASKRQKCVSPMIGRTDQSLNRDWR